MSGRAYGVRRPGFVGNRTAEWAPGAASTAGQVFGWTFGLAGAAGSATVPALATGSLLAQLPRMRFTATGSNAVAGLIGGQTVCWRGNAAGTGGFHFAARFALTGNFNGTRAFIGLSAQSTSVVATSDPTSVVNTIGVGFLQSGTAAGNWQLLSRDGSVTVGMVDLTSAPRNTTDVYDLSLLCAPNTTTVFVRLVNLTTGAVAIDQAASFALPASTALLYAHFEVGAAASGQSPSIDLVTSFLDVPDGTRTWPGLLGEDGVYNVRDFGAVGDEVTPDDTAFDSAIRALSLGGGGTLLVPPGRYLLSRDLVFNLNVTGSVIVRGVAPGSGHNASRLTFAPYKGLRFYGPPNTGTATSELAASVEDLDLFGGHVFGTGLRAPEHPVWSATTSYGGEATVGATPAKVVVPGPRSSDPNASFEYYYENVNVTSSSGGVMPSFATTQRVDPSIPWKPSVARVLHDVVRAAGRFDRLFVCTQAGTSGAGTPAWNFTIGATTVDGGARWQAFDSTGYFVADGGTLAAPTGPVWACRVCAGITTQSRVSLNRLLLTGFLNAGVHVQSPEAGQPRANALVGASSYDVKVIQCGAGIVTRGAVKRCTFVGLDIFTFDQEGGWTAAEADRAIGICERTTDGNTYVSFQVAATEGPFVYVPDVDNASALLGCYSEGLCGPGEIASPKVSVWGGTFGTLFTPTSAFHGVTTINDWRKVEATATTGGVTISAKLKPDDGSVYGFSSSDDATPYKLTYGSPTTGWWGLDHGANTAIAYSGGNAAEGGGFVWTPRGIFVGPSKILVTNGTGVPTLGDGTWRRGDIIVNRDAQSGQPSYWQCVVAGDPGTWLAGPSLP
ncbi:MAG: hypothetical protein JST00_14765 [Deltaproteobacteria bacterium]|nr:hypothetical protein [Deltaproteobacteria bacterium]